MQFPARWAGQVWIMNPCISTVVPCYDESGNIGILKARFSGLPLFAAGKMELVLVDDGSRDDTWLKISQWASAASNVTAVKLLQDRGNQYAILTGIAVARGDVIAVMDADMQDPPELLPVLLDIMNARALAAVIGTKISRHDALKGLAVFKDVATFVFPFKRGEGDFCLLKKEVAKKILAVDAGSIPFRVRRYWAVKNERVSYFPYERAPRSVGQTKFNMLKLSGLWWQIFKGIYLTSRFQRPAKAFKPEIDSIVKSQAPLPPGG